MDMALASFMVDKFLFVKQILHVLYPLKLLYQRKTFFVRTLLMLEVGGHLRELRMLRNKSARMSF